MVSGFFSQSPSGTIIVRTFIAKREVSVNDRYDTKELSRNNCCVTAPKRTKAPDIHKKTGGLNIYATCTA
jgi:hypothetical protein